MIGEVDTMSTSFDPRSFWHWGIDLFEIEFALYAFFVDIWDHVRRLDEWH